MAEQRIDVAQEIHEQSIDVLRAGAEQNIEIGSEPSVLHGIDGVSPIATVTQTETGATISITDRDGTTTATITNGQDGERGPQGERGEQGIQGVPGIQGEKGDRGEQGIQGERGPQGIQGERGATGATGATGPAGPAGSDGRDGQDGFSPIANVTKSGDTAIITITDKNGTTTATVKDGSDATVTVDSTLSSTSENPVQNKVINSALNAKADSSDIPTKTSDLTNDGASGTSTYVEADELATVATTGDYDDLTNKPTIPTAGTITSGSTGYATGGDVYNAIGNVETILSTLNNGGGAQ